MYKRRLKCKYNNKLKNITINATVECIDTLIHFLLSFEKNNY